MFETQAEWEKKYAELDDKLVYELHETLKPYFLRRTKDQVLQDLPPKVKSLEHSTPAFNTQAVLFADRSLSPRWIKKEVEAASTSDRKGKSVIDFGVGPIEYLHSTTSRARLHHPEAPRRNPSTRWTRATTTKVYSVEYCHELRRAVNGSMDTSVRVLVYWDWGSVVCFVRPFLPCKPPRSLLAIPRLGRGGLDPPRYFDVDFYLHFHKVTAYSILLFSFIHVNAHYTNFSISPFSHSTSRSALSASTAPPNRPPLTKIINHPGRTIELRSKKTYIHLYACLIRVHPRILSERPRKIFLHLRTREGTEGVLGGQAVVKDVAGTWNELTPHRPRRQTSKSELKETVNSLVEQLTTFASEGTSAFARRDLSQTVTVDGQGEMLQVKETVNSLVDQLRSFASETTRVAREVGTEGKLGGQAEVKDVAGTWKELTESVNAMAANLTAQA
ncbi:hypothetical protein HDV00_010928, partial [Rhizophlyctis rosea]